MGQKEAIGNEIWCLHRWSALGRFVHHKTGSLHENIWVSDAREIGERLIFCKAFVHYRDSIFPLLNLLDFLAL